MQARLVLPPHFGPITADDVPDADVVIATWWETAFDIVHFPSSKGRKFYFVQHHEVHPHLPVHISGGSYYLPLKKITISSWLVDTMRDVYDDDTAALVPNSVDRSLFFAPERARQLVPTIGLMYSTIPFKGVDLALRAVEIVRLSMPSLRIVAFGAQRPTRRLSLPEGSVFHLRPAQAKLREIYACCDVFITASRSEGFGLPILEAMACRTPVVASRTGCAEDIVIDGYNGYVVDVENPETMAARIADVLALSNPDWRAMSHAAWSSIRAYTWDDAGGLFEAAISQDSSSTRA
jgi:glycosyltransferase involved in cell wall biosynthesis